MSKQMTIRGVPDEVARKLERLSRERGRSVNTTVVEILRQAVGVDARRERLAHYANWTREEFDQFEEALAAQRVIDEALWR
jgi:plasmid stability protein